MRESVHSHQAAQCLPRNALQQLAEAMTGNIFRLKLQARDPWGNVWRFNLIKGWSKIYSSQKRFAGIFGGLGLHPRIRKLSQGAGKIGDRTISIAPIKMLSYQQPINSA